MLFQSFCIYINLFWIAHGILFGGPGPLTWFHGHATLVSARYRDITKREAGTFFGYAEAFHGILFERFKKRTAQYFSFSAAQAITDRLRELLEIKQGFFLFLPRALWEIFPVTGTRMRFQILQALDERVEGFLIGAQVVKREHKRYPDGLGCAEGGGGGDDGVGRGGTHGRVGDWVVGEGLLVRAGGLTT